MAPQPYSLVSIASFPGKFQMACLVISGTEGSTPSFLARYLGPTCRQGRGGGVLCLKQGNNFTFLCVKQGRTNLKQTNLYTIYIQILQPYNLYYKLMQHMYCFEYGNVWFSLEQGNKLQHYLLDRVAKFTSVSRTRSGFHWVRTPPPPPHIYIFLLSTGGGVEISRDLSTIRGRLYRMTSNGRTIFSNIIL